MNQGSGFLIHGVGYIAGLHSVARKLALMALNGLFCADVPLRNYSLPCKPARRVNAVSCS